MQGVWQPAVSNNLLHLALHTRCNIYVTPKMTYRPAGRVERCCFASNNIIIEYEFPFCLLKQLPA
jgi:hypothetical protein